MAITALGLTFFPLYWIHHDCWQWLVSAPDGGYYVYNHWGHVHFWMMGYDWTKSQGDAFTGFQTFNFEVQDTWGPRSGDPNQQYQYNVIGTPKWYFQIEEIWRRVYIQQWDEQLKIPGTGILGRKGIRYDASSASQTFGPFREGQGFAPVFIDSARTLPIEYFTTEARDRLFRDNYVKNKYKAAGLSRPPYGDGTMFDPPPDGNQPIQGAPAAHPSWADGLYIYPTLEYQKVTPLNWERLPGYAAAHDIDNNNFGDGWSIQVTIPFKDPSTGKYKSPFGPAPNICTPPGQYFNGLVPVENQLVYRQANNSPGVGDPNDYDGGIDYANYPFGLTDQQSGQLLQFNNPYPNADGCWVQQCIGGIVRAKAVVTIESKIGGRQDIEITSTQYLPADSFAGTDQLEGAATP